MGASDDLVGDEADQGDRAETRSERHGNEESVAEAVAEAPPAAQLLGHRKSAQPGPR